MESRLEEIRRRDGMIEGDQEERGREEIRGEQKRGERQKRQIERSSEEWREAEDTRGRGNERKEDCRADVLNRR